MESATSSYYLGFDAVANGDLIDLPYRLLQKASIMIFGLSAYSVKLPSIIIGLLLGLLLILLLNRWFKSNVSLLASCLVVLSTPFLFLAGSGTPLVMLIFWPTLLLWLGSKIQGEKKPKPIYCFLFALALLLAIFTPYMLYFAIFCVFFVAIQPHLRFVVKSLPKLPLVFVGLIILAGVGTLVANTIMHPDTIMGLLFAKTYDITHFFDNLKSGFLPVFLFKGSAESVFLAPLVSLPMLALTLIGLFSTTKGFFASRNSIATLLLIFTVIITGFNPDAAIFIILPLSILVAHGLKYLLEKWYGLFPENPYARITAIFPLAILFSAMIVPSLLQYIYGYRYNPDVADRFSYDLAIVRENLSDEVLVVDEYYDFYKILENSMGLTVLKKEEGVSEEEMLRGVPKIALLHNTLAMDGYELSRIITSPMREDSDIIYLYSEKGE